MATETVQLAPSTGVMQNTAEPTVFSVPVVAFPTAYDYGYQWSVGLIVAGMLKRAKYEQNALPFVLANVALKERYRQYKYRHNLRGANAWNTWYNKFQIPTLARLGRPVGMQGRAQAGTP